MSSFETKDTMTVTIEQLLNHHAAYLAHAREHWPEWAARADDCSDAVFSASACAQLAASAPSECEWLAGYWLGRCMALKEQMTITERAEFTAEPATPQPCVAHKTSNA